MSETPLTPDPLAALLRREIVTVDSDMEAAASRLRAAGVTLDAAQTDTRLDYDRMVEAGLLDAYLNIRGVRDEAQADQMLRADITRYEEDRPAPAVWNIDANGIARSPDWWHGYETAQSRAAQPDTRLRERDEATAKACWSEHRCSTDGLRLVCAAAVRWRQRGPDARHDHQRPTHLRAAQRLLPRREPRSGDHHVET